MIQIDPSLAAGVGATLAASAHQQLERERHLLKNGYLGTAVAFAAFFLIPAMLYFLSGWPSWDSMYWWDRDSLPAWLPPIFVVVGLACFVLGFVGVHALARSGRRAAALALPGLLFLPACIITVGFYDRVLHVGTRSSYEAGAPVNLWGSDLLWAIVVVNTLYVAVPVALLGYRWAKAGLVIRAEGRRPSGDASSSAAA